MTEKPDLVAPEEAAHGPSDEEIEKLKREGIVE